MALIACPECEKTISDQVIACPNCRCRVRERRRQHAAPKAPKPKAAPEPDIPVAAQCRYLRGGLWSLAGRKRVVCRCPLCGMNTTTALEHAGTDFLCPHCHGSFRIPTVAAARRAEPGYDGFAVTGFVVGLAAIFLWEIQWVPPLAVMASAVGVGRTLREKRKGRGLAVTGISLGLVFLVATFIAYAE